ncbi:MAG: tRNA pseudouridine(55) synthase TruB [Candidatus Latescibacterota bacterium]
MKSTNKNPEYSGGILIVNKPSGWTSHDVVNKTRIQLQGIKVGHTGTLDPMATGVMILLIGKTTRLAYRFENDTKRYLAEITFGRSTDTYDCTGKTIKESDPSTVDIAFLSESINNLKGESEQIPPMYSAVKVGGKKLYQLARSGKTVERKPRKIFISSIRAALDYYPKIIVDIECSKGTYIRSIAHHLGEIVNCPAHLSNLVRTACGNHTIDEAVDFLSLMQASAEDIMELIKPVELITS